jgi:hypothetical protein
MLNTYKRIFGKRFGDKVEKFDFDPDPELKPELIKS